MKKVLLPLGLTLSILLVFVLGIILSENVAKNRKDTVDLIFEQQKKEKEMQQLNDAVSEHFNDFDKIELQTDKPLISKYEDDENNQVLARYQIINDDSTIGTLYIVYVTGGKDGLKIAVVVEPTNREILGYKIIENNETPSYFANIPQEFLNSFSNIDMKKPVFEFAINFTGATYSSKAIVRAIKMAREQFYQDINEDLPKPSVNFTFVSSVQWLSDLSKYTFKLDNETDIISVVLKYDNTKKEFSYESSEVTLSQQEIEALLATANQNRPRAMITAYNETENEFTFSSQSYQGQIIRGKIKLNSEGKITSYIITSADESYHYSPTYDNSGPDPLVTIPKDIRETGGTEGISNITGATITTEALKLAANVVKKVWEENK